VIEMVSIRRLFQRNKKSAGGSRIQVYHPPTDDSPKFGFSNAPAELTTALLLPPIFEPKEFAQDFKLGNETVNFLWLTYISDKETEYKLKYGYDKLVDKFTPDNFPQVFNPFRPSII
jgi:hypothetical protein